MSQKDLSGCQAWWVEKIGKFTFDIAYVPSVDNVLADALSCMYSEDAPGTVQAHSEYTYHNVVDNNVLLMQAASMPLLTGIEAVTISQRPHVEEVTDDNASDFVHKTADKQKEGMTERKTKPTIKIPPCKHLPEKTDEKSRPTIGILP